MWTAQRASTSSLSLTNFLYPGAWAAPTGVRYVSVRGDAVAAASLGDVATFLTLGTLGNPIGGVEVRLHEILGADDAGGWTRGDAPRGVDCGGDV